MPGMVTITSTTERQDGVTLVTATVASDSDDQSTPTRIRVEHRLDGSIWPPRRQGQPAAGWDDDGFEGVVPADGHLSIGFASPAEPADQPLALTAAEPATRQDDEMDTSEAIVHGLGDPSPPSLIEAEQRTDGETTIVGDACQCHDTDRIQSEDALAPALNGGNEADSLPPALDEWFSAVEGRIDRAERLQGDAAVDDAATALGNCGGIEGAQALDDHLATDVELLRTIERRAAALADCAESTSVSTDALEHLR